MRVRLLTSASGHLKPGDELEIPKDQAEALIRRGSAEAVTGKPAASSKPKSSKPKTRKK